MAAAVVQKVQSALGVGLVPPKVGDKLQTGLKLKEHSPAEATVTLDDIPGRILIVGVPGAFTPTCSNQIPGYVTELDSFLAKGIKAVYVVTVNDQFVTEAWKEKLGAADKAKIHFLADDNGAFTSAIGMGFDATGILGNLRSHRYALVVKDGVVEIIEQEPDDGKSTVTKADNLLAKL